MTKVLITGGCGFIGSHLSEYLIQKSYEVTVFDRYNINNHKGWLDSSKFKKDIKFILGDIRDFDSVDNSIKGQDIVIHMAALIGIPYSYISPLAYVKTNIEGTYNILESCRNHSIGNVIITSTSEVYGTAKYTPIDEFHSLQPQSPYSASKIAADNLAKSYFNSFGSNIKIIRPFNTYGPRQSRRAIIPTIIDQLISEKKVIELGSIHPIRDFTHVDDTCNAFLKLIKLKGNFGEEYNIGNNKSISIKDLISLLSNITGIRKKVKQSSSRIRPKKSEVLELRCNFDKFYKKTKWAPKIHLREGLENTYKWFLKNKDIQEDIYYV
mgnify:CR=1 FL=1